MPNIDPLAKQWQEDLSERVGRAVQRARKARGWTAIELARRCDELGYPISRVAISKIESNARAGKIDLAELVVLADALDTSPVVLIYPGPYTEPVEAMPGDEMTELAAAQWFSGEPHERISRQIHPANGQGEEARAKREAALRWIDNTRELTLWRTLIDFQGSRMAIMARAEFTSSDREQIAFYDNQIRRIQEELLRIEDQHG